MCCRAAPLTLKVVYNQLRLFPAGNDLYGNVLQGIYFYDLKIITPTAWMHIY